MPAPQSGYTNQYVYFGGSQGGSGSAVDIFQWTPGSPPTLTSIGGAPVQAPDYTATSLMGDGLGRFLYTLESCCTNAVYSWSIAPATGALTAFTAGIARPYSQYMSGGDPYGKFMYARTTTNYSVLPINQSTGALGPGNNFVTTYTTTGTTSYIIIAP